MACMLKKKKAKTDNKVYGCKVFFFSKPELAFTLSHIIETLGYLKLQKSFIAPQVLQKQIPMWNLGCKMLTGEQYLGREGSRNG